MTEELKPIVVDVHFLILSKKHKKYVYFFRVTFKNTGEESYEGPFEFIPHKGLPSKKWEEFHLALTVLGMIQTRIKAERPGTAEPIYVHSDFLKFSKKFPTAKAEDIPECIRKLFTFIRHSGNKDEELTILLNSESLPADLRKNGRNLLNGYVTSKYSVPRVTTIDEQPVESDEGREIQEVSGDNEAGGNHVPTTD